MAIGPVQLLVLGFNHADFHGEVIAELERLRERDTEATQVHAMETSGVADPAVSTKEA
jgi:hypothetical protein